MVGESTARGYPARSKCRARLPVVPLEDLENVEHIWKEGPILLGEGEGQIASVLIELDEPSQNGTLGDMTTE